MSDQGLSSENSPDVVGPAGTGEAEQAEPEVNWQQRYVDTQDAYTRGQQELSELRRRDQLHQQLLSDDSEAQRQAAEALGYRLDEEEEADPGEYDDPFAAYDERIRHLEETQTQARDSAAQAEYFADLQAIVNQRLNELEGLSQEDQDWVLSFAVHALPATEDGLPDLDQAFQLFQERENARQRTWAQSKRAPRISPNGQTGTEVPNLDDRQQRQDWMTRRLQENEAQ